MGRTEHKGRSRVATVEREEQGAGSEASRSKRGSQTSAPEALLGTDLRNAPLERKASGPVLDELLLIELELHRRYREHLARTKPQPSAEKASIVAALRSKH